MVFEQASRCNEFLRDRPGWRADWTQMAMVLRDIQAVNGATLPDGLDFRPVNRDTSTVPDAVPMKDAAAVGIASNRSITGSADDVAKWISGLPSSVRLFAAIDESGVAHATSACHVFGDYTQIFFVNTEPAWRRGGIGQAMTSEALRAAASLGARRALLHATDDGASVYTRLGCEDVGLLTRYSGAD